MLHGYGFNVLLLSKLHMSPLQADRDVWIYDEFWGEWEHRFYY